MRKLARRLAAGLFLVAAAAAALAQEYPSHPVRILVPYGPGTGVDLSARILAEQLTKDLGQSFVVENKPGAGGAIAGAAVAAATPDGYTLMMNAGSQTSLPALMKLPYDGRHGFIGVAQMASTPFVLVASKTRGFKTVKDLVAAAKANPGAITFASAGVGTSTYLAAEKFRRAAGFEALHVPYKSTTDALSELISGRIDYLVTTVASALGPARSGMIVPLALGLHRSPQLPGVPTLAEAGVANAESETWFALFAPAKTPREIVDKLHATVNKSLASPDIQEKLARIGAEPTPISVEEFNAKLEREFDENERMLKSSGVKMQ